MPEICTQKAGLLQFSDLPEPGRERKSYGRATSLEEANGVPGGV